MFNNSEKMHIQYTLDKNIENKKLLWIPKEGEDGEESKGEESSDDSSSKGESE